MSNKLNNQAEVNAPIGAEASASPNLFNWMSPLNNPKHWAKYPMYQPPSSVDLIRAQKEVDSIVGVTRENKSIIKIIWNGDRKYWLKYFTKWNALGHGIGEPMERPLVRHGAIVDENKKIERDIFPPRWLFVIRLEPEQYAAGWKRESWLFDPAFNALKQIRPDEPPAEYWLWYATVCRHSSHCCATAEKNRRKCYGDYAPPSAMYETLGLQVRACEASGVTNNPFAMVDAETANMIQDENNGYLGEIQQMQVESEIYMDNPLALLGIGADMSPAKAKALVKDYYDRKIQDTSKLIK